MTRSLTLTVTLSVDDASDDTKTADDLFDYLCADELNGLSVDIVSIDRIDVVS